MRPPLFLTALALALFTGLSVAAPGTQPVGRVPKLSSRYTEIEPSAVFSEQQLLERPTRAKGRRLAARASPQPVKYGYNIEILKSDGSHLGYLSRTTNDAGIYSCTTLQNDAIAIDAPTSFSSNNLVFASSGHNNIGAVVGRSSKSSVMMQGSANAEATPTGSGPAHSSNDYNDKYAGFGADQEIETAVWQYSSSSDALDIVWVNTDGSKINITPLVKDGTQADGTKSIFFAGDAKAFTQRLSAAKFQQVSLKLTPI